MFVGLHVLFFFAPCLLEVKSGLRYGIGSSSEGLQKNKLHPCRCMRPELDTAMSRGTA